MSKKCPIYNVFVMSMRVAAAALKAEYTEAPDAADCREEKCEWFDEKNGRCGVITHGQS